MDDGKPQGLILNTATAAPDRCEIKQATRMFWIYNRLRE